MSEVCIILIEDHDLTRMGLRTALQRQHNIRVIGEAPNATQGRRLLETLKPDVAIVDIGLPDMDGIELTRQFRQFQAETNDSSTKILILTMLDAEESVLAAFAAGADSYCMKDISIERLTEAVHSTYNGNSWIDPSIARIVLRQVRQKSVGVAAPSPQREATKAEPEMLLQGEPLTERELEVLELIVNGYSNAAIAEKLYITVGTVKTHVRNILNKLCADDRTQAAVRALRYGIVF